MASIASLRSDMTTAMKAGDALVVSTLRLLISALSYAAIDLGHEPNESEVEAVLLKEAKKRKESIELYKSANREELLKQEMDELLIIEKYLPKQMSDEEAMSAIRDIVGNMPGANMGEVMKEIKQKYGNSIDGKKASVWVKEILGNG